MNMTIIEEKIKFDLNCWVILRDFLQFLFKEMFFYQNDDTNSPHHPHLRYGETKFGVNAWNK
jgi:hypothetical protein